MYGGQTSEWMPKQLLTAALNPEISSAHTALKLRTHPVVMHESVRFVAEQDSLNASLLGPDAAPGTPEFDLFIREVATEMTVKAGQKCTAIRRAMAPAQYLDAVEQALAERLARTKVGDPRADDTRMGALVSLSQRDDVRLKIAEDETGQQMFVRSADEFANRVVAAAKEQGEPKSLVIICLTWADADLRTRDLVTNGLKFAVIALKPEWGGTKRIEFARLGYSEVP